MILGSPGRHDQTWFCKIVSKGLVLISHKRIVQFAEQRKWTVFS